MKAIVKLVLLGSLPLIMSACGTKAEEAVEAERVENVKVTALKERTVTRELKLSTTLEGYETVNVSPSVTGTIEKIMVEVGDRVKAGQLLVRMDQTQLNTTRLTMNNVALEYERVKLLRETETVTQQAYDQAKMAYDQTRENLAFLEANTFYKAPIGGVISARNYEDGELYSGTPILVLTQTHQLKALISIPERYVPQIKEGMSLQVESDVYPGETFPASIEIVYPTIDPGTHTFMAKVKIPNADNRLRPGMFVRTHLQVGEATALMVPYQAVLKLTGSNERYVFVHEQGAAKRVRVTLGQRFDSLIEVESDELQPGDELVTVGQARLVDGVKLNVIQ
ncbi:MAG TPA: efflux RND transporter periplasmic adaptor subunit [Bacteroidales bacterium]|nr:efflux RND transporter periplasmic adaptor subunit [Bacteroidales bacterium]